MTRYFTDLGEARSALSLWGGWLLKIDDHQFIVTDDLVAIHEERGADWVENCEAAKCHDETRFLP